MSATQANPALTASGAPTCPKCGGEMWDNRTSKRNPKAPDFRCRDRSCDGALWPGQHEAPSVRSSHLTITNGKGGGARGDGSAEHAVSPSSPLRTCYLDAARFVLAEVRPLYERAGLACADSTVAAITATIFIATCKNGHGGGGV
jgi:hypothetical protein